MMWIFIIALVSFLLLIIVGIFYDNIIPPILHCVAKLLDKLAKLNLKNPFKSRQGAKKVLALGYSFSLMIIFLGLAWNNDLRTKGYIDVGRVDPVIAVGGDAIITIYGLLICGSALLLYSIYITVFYFVLGHSGELDQPSGPHLQKTFCGKCGSVSTVADTPDLQCKKCGSQVEVVEGYLDRHDGFRVQNRRKGNG
jgi:hypothetical protein